jgi:hypothetical protein
MLRVTLFKSQLKSLPSPTDNIVFRATSESRKGNFSCSQISVFGKDEGMKPNNFDTKTNGLTDIYPIVSHQVKMITFVSKAVKFYFTV